MVFELLDTMVTDLTLDLDRGIPECHLHGPSKSCVTYTGKVCL